MFSCIMAKLEMAKIFIQYRKGFAIWISSGNVYYLAYFDIKLAGESSNDKKNISYKYIFFAISSFAIREKNPFSSLWLR